MNSSSDSADGKKSRITRKHVIIAVTCAVVAAMVITGVVVGVKLFLDSTTEIVKVYYCLATTNIGSDSRGIRLGHKF